MLYYKGKSHSNPDTLSRWLSFPLTGDLGEVSYTVIILFLHQFIPNTCKQVPGVGEKAKETLMHLSQKEASTEKDINTTYQLIAKFLSFRDTNTSPEVLKEHNLKHTK